jgi:hypothetical protein
MSRVLCTLEQENLKTYVHVERLFDETEAHVNCKGNKMLCQLDGKNVKDSFAGKNEQADRIILL